MKEKTSRKSHKKIIIVFASSLAMILAGILMKVKLNIELPRISFIDAQAETLQKPDEVDPSLKQKMMPQGHQISEKFLNELLSRSRQIREQELELKLKEKELQVLIEKFEKEKKIVDEYMSEVKQMVDQWDGLQNEKVNKLVEILANMPPNQAAQVLKDLNDKDVAKIMLRLNRKIASEIMSQLPIDKTQKISNIMLNSNVEK